MCVTADKTYIPDKSVINTHFLFRFVLCRSGFLSAPALLYAFMLSGGFSAPAWEHLGWDILDLYTLSGIDFVILIVGFHISREF